MDSGLFGQPGAFRELEEPRAWGWESWTRNLLVGSFDSGAELCTSTRICARTRTRVRWLQLALWRGTQAACLFRAHEFISGWVLGSQCCG